MSAGVEAALAGPGRGGRRTSAAAAGGHAGADDGVVVGTSCTAVAELLPSPPC